MRQYLRIIAWIFMAVAAILLGRAAHAVYDWNRRIAVYEMTYGVVTELIPNADSTRFFPLISFKSIDNQRQKIKSRLPDDMIGMGDSVQVLYDIANPDDMLLVHLHPVQRSKAWVTGAAFLLIVSLLILFRLWQQNNRRQILQSSGRILHAAYQTTETAQWLFFRFYRAQLSAQVSYPQEQTFRFVSEWFTEDPAPYWKGKQVRVYLDAMRDDEYWVDTELLPTHILT